MTTMKQFLMTVVMLTATTLQLWAQTAEADEDALYATELLKPGTDAPDFTLLTPEGKAVSLSDFRGQYVVLDFWASWCPDCRKDIPEVKALAREYEGKGVAVLSVSFDTDKARWTKCIADYELNWTHVSPLQKWKTKNEDGSLSILVPVADDYHVNWIPSMYLIDREGRVMFGTVMVEKISTTLATISALEASNTVQGGQ